MSLRHETSGVDTWASVLLRPRFDVYARAVEAPHCCPSLVAVPGANCLVFWEAGTLKFGNLFSPTIVSLAELNIFPSSHGF